MFFLDLIYDWLEDNILLWRDHPPALLLLWQQFWILSNLWILNFTKIFSITSTFFTLSSLVTSHHSESVWNSWPQFFGLWHTRIFPTIYFTPLVSQLLHLMIKSIWKKFLAKLPVCLGCNIPLRNVNMSCFRLKWKWCTF